VTHDVRLSLFKVHNDQLSSLKSKDLILIWFVVGTVFIPPSHLSKQRPQSVRWAKLGCAILLLFL
jgi:hypothetical protein